MVVMLYQTETPEDQALVPDHVLQPPFNFTKFINKKSDTKKRMAAAAPTLDDLIADIQGTEEDTVASRRKEVDAAREAGLDAADAHEAIHGEVDTTNPEEMGKLAATVNRVQNDGSVNKIVTDDGESKSLLAQDDDYEEDLQGLEDDIQKQIAELQSKSTRMVRRREAMATFRETFKNIPSGADRSPSSSPWHTQDFRRSYQHWCW